MDATMLLKQDHDEVRGLFERFRSAKESDDVSQMAQLVRQIFSELEVHTAIEEEIFYPESRDLDDDELGDAIDEGRQEHHVVKILMSEIRELDPGDDDYAAKMTVLIENVEHHAEEEESDLFPEVRERMSPDDLDQLGLRLQARKQQLKRSGGGGPGSGAQVDLTRDELYERAQELDIEGRSSMNKDELAEAVRKVR